MASAAAPAAAPSGATTGADVRFGGRNIGEGINQTALARRADSYGSPVADAAVEAFAALDALRPREIAALLRLGVPPAAIPDPPLARRARVTFSDDGRHFDFADEIEGGPSVPAIAFVARDEAGAVRDLASWEPATGRSALYFGTVPALGMENIFAPQIAYDGALPVFENALEWLRDGMFGLLALDPEKLAPLLRQVGSIVVDNVELGVRLRDADERRRPKIVVIRSKLDASDAA